MSAELDKIVNKLAVESGAEANMGTVFEPHETEEGDLVIFRDLAQDPPQRVVGVCMANQNGLLTVVTPVEETLLYRVSYSDVENIQLLYRSYNPIYQNELRNLCIKTREYCGLNNCWRKAEDLMIANYIKWRQEKFHPTPPPKLSFFKKLRKFIWE